MKRKISTAQACDVAAVDRLRFNEAVAEGFYPCAPPTTKGIARQFGEDDLVVLVIYGQLLEVGVTPRHAGYIACKVLSCLESHAYRHRSDEAPPEPVITLFKVGGYFLVKLAEEVSSSASEIGLGERTFPVLLRINFEIGNIRRIITRRIDEIERNSEE